MSLNHRLSGGEMWLIPAAVRGVYADLKKYFYERNKLIVI
jgi:hypothetical protein